jgi:hypothetical protein
MFRYGIALYPITSPAKAGGKLALGRMNESILG